MHRITRAFSIGLIVAPALLISRVGQTQPSSVAEKPHRVGIAPTAQFLLDFDDDDRSAPAAGLSLSYAYRVAPHVELGAEARYLRVFEHAPDLFLPSLMARFSTPVGLTNTLEFGTSVRVGSTHQTFHDTDGEGHSKHALGAALAIAPDLRLRLSDGFALQVAAEGTVGARLHAVLRDEWEDPYGTFVAAGISAGVVAKF